MAQKYTGFQKFAFGFAVVCAVAAIGKLSSSDKASESGASNPHRDAEMTEIKLQRLARELVTANLKDPDSAKFRNQKGVCGEVNAKNSFGGYAGFVRFIAGGKDLVIMENNPALAPGAFKESWDRFCK